MVTPVYGTVHILYMKFFWFATTWGTCRCFKEVSSQAHRIIQKSKVWSVGSKLWLSVSRLQSWWFLLKISKGFLVSFPKFEVGGTSDQSKPQSAFSAWKIWSIIRHEVLEPWRPWDAPFHHSCSVLPHLSHLYPTDVNSLDSILEHSGIWVEDARVLSEQVMVCRVSSVRLVAVQWGSCIIILQDGPIPYQKHILLLKNFEATQMCRN